MCASPVAAERSGHGHDQFEHDTVADVWGTDFGCGSEVVGAGAYRTIVGWNSDRCRCEEGFQFCSVADDDSPDGCAGNWRTLEVTVIDIDECGPSEVVMDVMYSHTFVALNGQCLYVQCVCASYTTCCETQWTCSPQVRVEDYECTDRGMTVSGRWQQHTTRPSE
jgi:hypothetical protein